MKLLRAERLPNGDLALCMHLDETKVLPDPAYVRSATYGKDVDAEVAAREFRLLCEAELASLEAPVPVDLSGTALEGLA